MNAGGTAHRSVAQPLDDIPSSLESLVSIRTPPHPETGQPRLFIDLDTGSVS